MKSSLLKSDRRLRSKLLTASALIAPIVFVVAARQIMGLQPASSQAAAVSADPPADQPSSATVRSLAQNSLVVYLAAAGDRLPALVSPMDHPPAPPVPVIQTPAPASAIVATPTIEAKPAAPLVLSAIMAGANPASVLVMISGKVYRLGESVTPGWTLTKIDAKSLTVTLQGADNQEFTLARDPR